MRSWKSFAQIPSSAIRPELPGPITLHCAASPKSKTFAPLGRFKTTTRFGAGTSNDRAFASTGPRRRDRHTQNGKKVQCPRRAVMAATRSI